MGRVQLQRRRLAALGEAGNAVARTVEAAVKAAAAADGLPVVAGKLQVGAKLNVLAAVALALRHRDAEGLQLLLGQNDPGIFLAAASGGKDGGLRGLFAPNGIGRNHATLRQDPGPEGQLLLVQGFLDARNVVVEKVGKGFRPHVGCFACLRADQASGVLQIPGSGVQHIFVFFLVLHAKRGSGGIVVAPAGGVGILPGQSAHILLDHAVLLGNGRAAQGIAVVELAAQHAGDEAGIGVVAAGQVFRIRVAEAHVVGQHSVVAVHAHDAAGVGRVPASLRGGAKLHVEDAVDDCGLSEGPAQDTAGKGLAVRVGQGDAAGDAAAIHHSGPAAGGPAGVPRNAAGPDVGKAAGFGCDNAAIFQLHVPHPGGVRQGGEEADVGLGVVFALNGEVGDAVAHAVKLPGEELPRVGSGLALLADGVEVGTRQVNVRTEHHPGSRIGFLACVNLFGKAPKLNCRSDNKGRFLRSFAGNGGVRFGKSVPDGVLDAVGAQGGAADSVHLGAVGRHDRINQLACRLPIAGRFLLGKHLNGGDGPALQGDIEHNGSVSACAAALIAAVHQLGLGGKGRTGQKGQHQAEAQQKRQGPFDVRDLLKHRNLLS